MKNFIQIGQMVSNHLHKIRDAKTERGRIAAWNRYTSAVGQLSPFKRAGFTIEMMWRLQFLMDYVDDHRREAFLNSDSSKRKRAA
jgi:hypothetical protein